MVSRPRRSYSKTRLHILRWNSGFQFNRVSHKTLSKDILTGNSHFWSQLGILGVKYYVRETVKIPLLWRHNGLHGVSNHQPHDCLLNRLFWRRSKKTSKLRVTGLCAGNSPVTGEFPAQRANNAENVSIWWRHHDSTPHCFCTSTAP